MILKTEAWPIGEETYRVMPYFSGQTLAVILCTIVLAVLVVFLTREK